MMLSSESEEEYTPKRPKEISEGKKSDTKNQFNQSKRKNLKLKVVSEVVVRLSLPPNKMIREKTRRQGIPPRSRRRLQNRTLPPNHLLTALLLLIKPWTNPLKQRGLDWLRSRRKRKPRKERREMNRRHRKSMTESRLGLLFRDSITSWTRCLRSSAAKSKPLNSSQQSWLKCGRRQINRAKKGKMKSTA